MKHIYTTLPKREDKKGAKKAIATDSPATKTALSEGFSVNTPLNHFYYFSEEHNKTGGFWAAAQILKPKPPFLSLIIGIYFNILILFPYLCSEFSLFAKSLYQ